jgi:hypothetical protein
LLPLELLELVGLVLVGVVGLLLLLLLSLASMVVVVVVEPNRLLMDWGGAPSIFSRSRSSTSLLLLSNTCRCIVAPPFASAAPTSSWCSTHPLLRPAVFGR